MTRREASVFFSLPRARAMSNIGLVIPVSISPGQIAFTRTPVPAS